MDDSLGRIHLRHKRHRKLVPALRSKRVTRETSVVRLSPNYVLVPECRSVISGSVTTVHVEGNNSVSAQLSKLQVKPCNSRFLVTKDLISYLLVVQ